MAGIYPDKQEISNFPNDFRDLPQPLTKVKDQLITRVLNGNLDDYYGLLERAPFYRVYHATVETKLPAIAQDGLKAFFEKEENSPRIFITPSPTLALWHAIENKPHDTLRKKALFRKVQPMANQYCFNCKLTRAGSSLTRIYKNHWTKSKT